MAAAWGVPAAWDISAAAPSLAAVAPSAACYGHSPDGTNVSAPSGDFGIGGPSAAAAVAGGGADRGLRGLNGWTVVWVGERAFRAPVAIKEQLESIGFLVKVYRSHEKCCRALDKKSHIAPTNVFVVSEVDSEPLMAYLRTRNARHLHIIVDADASTNPASANLLASSPACPQDSSVVVAFGWDEVLVALRDFAAQVSAQQPAAASMAHHSGGFGVPVEAASSSSLAWPRAAAGAPPIQGAPRSAGGSEMGAASGTPWTLVWVSDQAFKPAAGGQKIKLESLGCQVKGYKTHKNAARALDKKRALLRTVVLVSGVEAAPLLAYFSSRPELGATPVVVEAGPRAVPVRENATTKVAEDFEAALAAVWEIAADPGFS